MGDRERISGITIRRRVFREGKTGERRIRCETGHRVSISEEGDTRVPETRTVRVDNIRQVI